MVKKLLSVKKKKSGRGFLGQIAVRHRGGGYRLQYRKIDFKRSLFDMPALVLCQEFDPNRSSFILLILYKNGILSYINSVSQIKKGDILITSKKASILCGNCLPISEIPIGSILSNIELHYGKGSQICRSAGTFGILVARKTFRKNKNFSIVRFRSGEEYILYNGNLACLGVNSNQNYYLKNLGKAGVARKLGIRPSVRGVAMNPIDHPHGGGEGKTSGGRPSVSKWAKLTKGKRTRDYKKSNIFIFKTRRFNKFN